MRYSKGVQENGKVVKFYITCSHWFLVDMNEVTVGIADLIYNCPTNSHLDITHVCVSNHQSLRE